MHDDRCAWIPPGPLGCCAPKLQIGSKLCETEAALAGAALNLSDTAPCQLLGRLPMQGCQSS